MAVERDGQAGPRINIIEFAGPRERDRLPCVLSYDLQHVGEEELLWLIEGRRGAYNARLAQRWYLTMLAVSSHDPASSLPKF